MTFISALKKVLHLMLASLASLALAGAAHAVENGTAAEAEAMVKKAISYIKAQGPEKAYEEFTNGKSFKDRDLYIIVYDLNGKTWPKVPTPNWWART